MKRRYQEFILEKIKINLQMILEDQLYGSASFMDRLSQISKRGGGPARIADVIIGFIDDEGYLDSDDVKQNFFDSTDKEGMISFLMNSKLTEWDAEEDPALPYSYKGRGEMAIGKAIRYIMTLIDDKPSDKDVEEFVNAYKATQESDVWKFKMLEGVDIAKYYNQKKYFMETGSLGSSCMADESKGTFKLYSQNPDKVRLLVLIDEEADKICGRALVWKLKKSPCTAQFFMDRVYANRDSDVLKFKKFAEESGFLYKAKMNSHTETNVDFIFNGAPVSGVIKVGPLAAKFSNYPFVDTLCFLDEDRGSISNVSSKKCTQMHSTHGEDYPCDDCDSKCFREEGGTKYICSNCSDGHIELKAKGIETPINKKYESPYR
jgi:hypothetical protein